jgi:hypothetical protein
MRALASGKSVTTFAVTTTERVRNGHEKAEHQCAPFPYGREARPGTGAAKLMTGDPIGPLGCLRAVLAAADQIERSA